MLCNRKSSAVLFYSYDTLVSLKICTLLKDSAKRLSLLIRKKKPWKFVLLEQGKEGKMISVYLIMENIMVIYFSFCN